MEPASALRSAGSQYFFAPDMIHVEVFSTLIELPILWDLVGIPGIFRFI
jgi:hypothetical protein